MLALLHFKRATKKLKISSTYIQAAVIVLSISRFRRLRRFARMQLRKQVATGHATNQQELGGIVINPAAGASGTAAAPVVNINLHIHLPENKSRRDYRILSKIGLEGTSLTATQGALEQSAAFEHFGRGSGGNKSGPLGRFEACRDASHFYEAVIAALNSFTDVVRYLNTRRSTGAILELSNEGCLHKMLVFDASALILIWSWKIRQTKLPTVMRLRIFCHVRADL